MYSILVTTGATITFTTLLEQITNHEVIKSLILLNVSHLTIQYGNETRGGVNISTSIFEDILSKSDLLAKLDLRDTSSPCTSSKSYTSPAFTLEVLPFTSDINSFIHKADIVISHAGTGSIIDTLRLQKNLIVITNDTLMNNHQTEIANEFSLANYCVAFSTSQIVPGPSAFISTIEKLLNNSITLTPFPPPSSNVIASIVTQELLQATGLS